MVDSGEKRQLLDRWEPYYYGTGTSVAIANVLSVLSDWSDAVHGPGSRKKGILAHLQKELQEVENAESFEEELKEWIDIAILALNGATRLVKYDDILDGDVSEGYAVSRALLEKINENLHRKWPDWRKYSEDVAIEHVREENENA